MLTKVFNEVYSASDYRYEHNKIDDLVKNFRNFTLSNDEVSYSPF